MIKCCPRSDGTLDIKEEKMIFDTLFSSLTQLIMAILFFFLVIVPKCVPENIGVFLIYKSNAVAILYLYLTFLWSS